MDAYAMLTPRLRLPVGKHISCLREGRGRRRRTKRRKGGGGGRKGTGGRTFLLLPSSRAPPFFLPHPSLLPSSLTLSRPPALRRPRAVRRCLPYHVLTPCLRCPPHSSATCIVYLTGVGGATEGCISPPLRTFARCRSGVPGEGGTGSRACVRSRAWPGGGFLTPCPRRTFNIFNGVPSEFAEASRKLRVRLCEA